MVDGLHGKKLQQHGTFFQKNKLYAFTEYENVRLVEERGGKEKVRAAIAQFEFGAQFIHGGRKVPDGDVGTRN